MGPATRCRAASPPTSSSGWSATTGSTVRAVHGVRSFADLVPGALVDAEPGAAEALLALERVTADHADFRAVATQLHVLAVRPALA